MWFRGLDEDPIDKIVGYRNEEEFKIGLRAISYRVTRDEVSKIKTVVRNKKVVLGKILHSTYKQEQEILNIKILLNLISDLDAYYHS